MPDTIQVQNFTIQQKIIKLTTNKPNLAKAHDIKSNLTATKLKESQ